MTDIDDLRQILIGTQLPDDLHTVKDQVSDISRRLDDVEIFTNNVARVLPNAVVRADDNLSDSLEQPITAAIANSVERNPNEFAAILFPVMGPAIRAAIADAMRSIMSSINESVEATVSMRGIQWRLQAWRTGTPYAEIALRNTFVYRVEQVFLINRKDGLVIEHSTAADVVERDTDAVSAMFSAVQDFVRDSFSRNQNDALSEIEVGEHTVWSVHGPYAMLVAVVRGSPPNALRARLLETIEAIHANYGNNLKSFKGESGAIPGLHAKLEDCLELEFKEPTNHDELKTNHATPGSDEAVHRSNNSLQPRSRTRLLLTRVLPIAIVAAGLIGFGVNRANVTQRFQTAVELVDATPGFIITHSSHDGDHIRLQGLRDPLAILDHEPLRQAGIDKDELTLTMDPYLSLEPAIVERRSMRMLALPKTVTASLDKQQVLHLSGVVSDQVAVRIDRWNAEGVLLPGVSQIDTSSLRLSRGAKSATDDNQASLTQ